MFVVQMLCAKGAQALQTKSINVEDAVNELINMLLDTPKEDEEEEEPEQAVEVVTENGEEAGG